MDRGLYGGVQKHVGCLLLRFSPPHDAASEVRTAAFVSLNGGSTLQGTAHRGSSYSASLCVSCLAPTLDVTETRFSGYGDHRHYRRHKGRALQPEICVYLAPRTVASVRPRLLDPPSYLGPWSSTPWASPMRTFTNHGRLPPRGLPVEAISTVPTL